MPISLRYLVKWKIFPYKHLISIIQFVWQLYTIVIRSIQFLRKLHFCLRKQRMPNFGKILHQIKKFPIQWLASDCSVCMAAICYSGNWWTNLHTIVHMYRRTDGRTDRRTWLNQLSSSCWSLMYIFYRVSYVSFLVFKLRCKLNTPCSGHRNASSKIKFHHSFRKRNELQSAKDMCIYSLACVWTKINIIKRKVIDLWQETE